MGIWKDAKEKYEAKVAQQRHAALQQRMEAVVTQARAARAQGLTIFQVTLEIAENERTMLPSSQGWDGYNTRRVEHGGSSEILSAVQAEGWELAHFSASALQTGSVSRDKFLSSGQETGFSGVLFGVYVFRRAQ
ncbi:hypothetical protein [Streptoalloteichus hindustanus]|uniref:Uncharacterized protein n=1 Tax=Streptoalloteichus hindustanus TaxID=2017 RepID=A0A1M5NF03_STRHI|nr:hypothetical protein [Streptoalloteichus hindustanus]SHG87543.1 hypothetical protein SAMN05444320_115102 [Streptoalloteichus hindustanus]